MHHFWQLQTHTYNVANDAAALSKIHKRSLDDKQVFALLNFQTASENFDSGKGNGTNRDSICIWHYNHQDKFVIQVSSRKEKIKIFHF